MASFSLEFDCVSSTSLLEDDIVLRTSNGSFNDIEPVRSGTSSSSGGKFETGVLFQPHKDVDRSSFVKREGQGRVEYSHRERIASKH